MVAEEALLPEMSAEVIEEGEVDSTAGGEGRCCRRLLVMSPRLAFLLASKLRPSVLARSLPPPPRAASHRFPFSTLLLGEGRGTPCSGRLRPSTLERLLCSVVFELLEGDMRMDDRLGGC